jgi:Domain of unknown function (DUF4349)
MIIRTAEVTLVVEDAAQALERVVKIVEREGGYVADTRQWRENDQVRATATVRVPAEKVFTVLPEIRKIALRVEKESVNGEDVSEEFSDLGAQLTNLQATEAELRQLLTTVRERTQKASDVLEVYDKLSKVRGDMDRIQGRLNFLKQMTALSTINLEFIPDSLSKPIAEPGWRPLAIAKTALRALVASLKGLAAVLIWVVVFAVPFLLVLGSLIALTRRLVWRLLRRRGPPQTEPPPQTPTIT